MKDDEEEALIPTHWTRRGESPMDTGWWVSLVCGGHGEEKTLAAWGAT
jgi:hypothetical protein